MCNIILKLWDLILLVNNNYYFSEFQVVFITLLSISWAMKIRKHMEDPKDKREAGIAYPAVGTSHNYQAPSFGHEHGANAISIGAGYSVGGGKPNYAYISDSGAGHQLQASEGLQPSGHSTIQLAPLTLQPSQGLVSSDLQQLMSQLSESLNSGALTLSPYQANAAHGGQDISLPQYTYGSPKLQQYSAPEQSLQVQSSVPAYAAGTKGLGSYSSTGPVLFNPADSNFAGSHGHALGAGSSGPSFADASALANTLANSGHSFGGLSLGGVGHSYGGLSLGSPGHSLSGPGHTLGSGSFGAALKGYSGGYVVPSKSSFKPSTYLGSQNDHGLSSVSGAYAAPSFGSHSLSGSYGGLSLGGHGASFGGSSGGFGGGSSKFIAASYQPSKSEGFGSSLENVASFSGSHSPPSTTYGFPSSHSAKSAVAAHAASSHSPQYYVKYSSPNKFGEGSSSYKAPASSHSSLSSHTARPKYGFSHRSSHYGSPSHGSDVHGAHSETVYNTIKYSEEIKPRVH